MTITENKNSLKNTSNKLKTKTNNQTIGISATICKDADIFKQIYVNYKVKFTPATKLRDDGYAPLSVPLLTSGSKPL